MSSSGSPTEDSSADVLNPYIYELRIHPKELILKEGKVQMKEVQGPKGEGSLEDGMEALEQEVFRYKKMAEREVDVIHKISAELITKHEGEASKLREEIFSLLQTTNQLQAQLYDIQNQNCEYEARFDRISSAASFRIAETRTSFLDREPFPRKFYDYKRTPPPPPKE